MSNRKKWGMFLIFLSHLYSIKCTVYSMHYTVYIVWCTLYSVSYSYTTDILSRVMFSFLYTAQWYSTLLNDTMHWHFFCIRNTDHWLGVLILYHVHCSMNSTLLRYPVHCSMIQHTASVSCTLLSDTVQC